MVQRRDDFSFTLEARQTVGIVRDIRRQHLHGDLPLQSDIGGAIDLAHPSHAKTGDDFVRSKPGSWRQRHGEILSTLVLGGDLVCGDDLVCGATLKGRLYLWELLWER